MCWFRASTILALSARLSKPSTNLEQRFIESGVSKILRRRRRFWRRTNSPRKLFRQGKLWFSPVKSLQRLLVIQSAECVILRAMQIQALTFFPVVVASLLVCQPQTSPAQPPLIFPQPRLKSLQAPAVRYNPSQNEIEPEEAFVAQDAWFLVEFDGATIGYESLLTTPVDEPERNAVVISATEVDDVMPRIRRSRETRLKLKRLGTDLSVSAHLETIESVDGVLESWSLRRTGADGTVIQKSATWDTSRKSFLIRGDAGAPTKVETIQSRVQPRSPIVPSWLMVEDVERPQRWASAVLFPETSAIVDVEIRQLPPQSIRIKDGTTIAVTRIDYWPGNQPEMRSSVYYDSEFQVVLVEQPLLGKTLRFYRTDAATALGEENLQALDLQFLTALPLRRSLLNPDKSNVVRMKVSVGDSEQISLPSSDFQAVEQIAPNSVVLKLTRPAVNADGTVVAGASRNITRPASRFTESSRWLDTKNDTVRRMAVMGGGAVSDPREKCRRLTSYINSHLRLAAFSTSLQPASEVAKSKQGDCTEYAVLLAAVMRSQGVPARVAVGFAYVANPASLVPHMWTEAWIDGQWIPFDATLGGEVNPLTRVKVMDSPLSDNVTNGTLLFVPLLNFLGRATVEILPEE